MLFRIVFIGNTGNARGILGAARELYADAHSVLVGVIAPDDALEATVESETEGRKLMRHVYQKTGCFPKYYAISLSGDFYKTVDRPQAPAGEGPYSFQLKERKYSPDVEVFSDRFQYVKPVVVDHFEDFLA